VTGPLPGTAPGLPSAEAELSGWHRLHPLTPLVRAGRHVLTIVIVLFGVGLFNQKQDNGQLIGDAVVIGVALVAGFISWLVTRWQVADGVLRVDTGLIRRDSRRIPLAQIQAIDVVQSGLARVLGLAELQLRVAGGDSSRGARLACLRLADAERLRAELLAFSASAVAGPAGRGVAGAAGVLAMPDPAAAAVAPAAAAVAPADADAAAAAGTAGTAGDPAAERLLFRVRSGRLAAGIILSRAGLISALVIAAVITVDLLTHATQATASFLPAAIGIVLAVWRWFNGEYGTTVAAAPDGLRLRSGLIQKTTETIRPGRVQGVRLVEPLVWRAFGWCRLEVDVAGPKQRGENRAEGQRLRALIPVGSRAEADQMLAELLSSQPAADRPAPGRARVKAPLTFHFLAWGGDDQYVVASRGRLSRKTTWVPLEKVQSIRWVQGPLQRRLGLASVRLDVAGRRVSGDIEDRSQAEASDLLARLPDLARSARARVS
jgi:putative membrane protein